MYQVNTQNRRVYEFLIEYAIENGYNCSWDYHTSYYEWLIVSNNYDLEANPTPMPYEKITIDRFLKITSETPEVVKLNAEYDAKVYKNKIVVGCQTFDKKTAENLYFAISKKMNPVPF